MINTDSRKIRALNNRPAKMFNRIAGWLIGALVLFYAYYVYCFSVNFPFQDDNSYLLVIHKVRENLGMRHVLHAFLRPENDHRLTIPRLIGYANYLLTGHPDFKAFILLVNLNILLIVACLYRLFRKLSLPFYLFLPVPFLMLQHQYHEITGWALNGMQHSCLTLFLFVAVLLLDKPSSRWRFFAAALFATMATFTHGNGFLVFGAGAFLLLTRKEYQKLIGWLVWMLVCLGVYLFHYKPGSGVESVYTFQYALGSFFGLIGANMAVWPSIAVTGSIAWGVVSCLILVPPLIRSVLVSFRNAVPPPLPELPMLAVFSFIALTAALIGIFRSNGEVLLASRFLIYPAISSCLVYLYVVYKLPAARKPAFFGLSFFLTLIFFGSSYYQFTQIVAYKKSRYTADSYNWRRHLTLVSQPAIGNSYYFLLPAYREGYWQVPDLFPGFDQKLKSVLAARTFGAYDFRLERQPDPVSGPKGENARVMITNGDIPFKRESFSDEICLILVNEATGKSYLAGTSPTIVGRKNLGRESYFRQGFQVFVPANGVPSGRYRLGCVRLADGSSMELLMSTTVVDF